METFNALKVTRYELAEGNWNPTIVNVVRRVKQKATIATYSAWETLFLVNILRSTVCLRNIRRVSAAKLARLAYFILFYQSSLSNIRNLMQT